MKTHSLILLAAVLACHGSAAAQTGSPRAQELQPRARETGVARDGIVFYRGQTYLVRNGRAALVDATLVPKGLHALHGRFDVGRGTGGTVSAA